MMRPMTENPQLSALSTRYCVDALYAFGSRAAEVAAFVRDGRRLELVLPPDRNIRRALL
jgi:hypothetical protein